MCLVSCIALLGASVAAGQRCGLCEDFDGYAAGDLCAQTAWEEWPNRQGMDGCDVVTDELALNGSQSLKIVGDPGGQFGFGDRFFQQADR
jgi:hypothetical protein